MTMTHGLEALTALAKHHSHIPHVLLGDLWIYEEQFLLYQYEDATHWIDIDDRLARQTLAPHLPDPNEYLDGVCIYGWLKTTETGVTLHNIYYLYLGDRPESIVPEWGAPIVVRDIPEEYNNSRYSKRDPRYA